MLALPQMRTQPRQQHVETKRLCHVIVRPGFEALYRVAVAVGRGQHEDRHGDRGTAQLAAQIAPIHVGQADIEQHRVKPFATDGIERHRRGIAFDDGEFGIALELLGERLAQRGIVVDDQNLTSSVHEAPKISVPKLKSRQPLAALFAAGVRAIPKWSPAGRLAINLADSDGFCQA